MGKSTIDLVSVAQVTERTIEAGEKCSLQNILTTSINYSQKALDVVVPIKGQKREVIIGTVIETANRLNAQLKEKGLNKVDFLEASGRGTPDDHKIIQTHYL